MAHLQNEDAERSSHHFYHYHLLSHDLQDCHQPRSLHIVSPSRHPQDNQHKHHLHRHQLQSVPPLTSPPRAPSSSPPCPHHHHHQHAPAPSITTTIRPPQHHQLLEPFKIPVKSFSSGIPLPGLKSRVFKILNLRASSAEFTSLSFCETQFLHL